ncbi:hypothetical protein NDA18_003753 [Ustilago nuda]|nr:hypothetical protein NDA18_003753 [Ustilago nuda]
MLIALIGPPGAGKASVASYLGTQLGFHLLALSSATTPIRPLSNLNASTDMTALSSSKEMLDYVTDRWNQCFVTLDLDTSADMEAFIKRPFFLCVEVSGPLLTRWSRWKEKHGEIRLEEFVALDDRVSFGPGSSAPTSPATGIKPGSSAMASSNSSSSLLTGGDGILHTTLSHTHTEHTSASSSLGLSALRRYVHLSIMNDHLTLPALHSHLSSLHLPSEGRLRPGWDTYFLKLCNLASLRSNCMKRRVGAVLVSSNRILATGYNGTPSGLANCNQGGCPRCNNTLGNSGCGQNLEECLCLHAEENALLEAGRAKLAEGVGGGATMYCNTCPCLRCAVKIIQTGIKKVVYQLEYSMDEKTKGLMRQAGVEIRQIHLDP